MNDDILDSLLLALLRCPRDTGLIKVIADFLEGADGEPHPAAAWWDRCVGLTNTAADQKWRIRVRSGLEWPSTYEITRLAEDDFPGIADLAQRLDRFAEQTRRDEVLAALRGARPEQLFMAE